MGRIRVVRNLVVVRKLRVVGLREGQFDAWRIWISIVLGVVVIVWREWQSFRIRFLRWGVFRVRVWSVGLEDMLRSWRRGRFRVRVEMGVRVEMEFREMFDMVRWVRFDKCVI